MLVKKFQDHTASFFTSSYLILVLGLSMTGIAYFLSYSYENDIKAKQFQHEAEQLSKKIELEMRRGIDLLRYLNAYLLTTESLEYPAFVSLTSQILTNHPEVKALEWVPKVTHEHRQSMESELQHLFPSAQFTENNNGKLIPARQRDTYYPAYFVTPYANNENALGYDLGSNPARLATLVAAQDSGEIQMSPKIRLVQDSDESNFGVIAFQPVYRKSSITATIEQRRENIHGFLVAVYRIQDIISIASAYHPNEHLAFKLSDNSTTTSYSKLYNSAAINHKVKSDLKYTYTFEIGGRNWSLSFMPSDTHYHSFYSEKTLAVLIIGFFISIITFSFLRSTHKKMRDLTTIQKQLKDANKELTLLSQYDGNLKIANRRYFDQYINSEWKRAIRSGHPISLIMADVDFFKNFNDCYGHVVGDQCLREIASRFTLLAARPADLVARYGGEEIAVIMPETTFNGTKHIAAAIRKSIELAAIPHKHSLVSPYVTISAGHGTITPTQNDDLFEFINLVDQQLYLAKKSGKNQVRSINLSSSMTQEISCVEARHAS